MSDTKVYIIRHSETLKDNLGVYISTDTRQEINEKCILSKTGEELASKLDLELDVLWSSSAVRAIGTAKYLSNDNVKLNINSAYKARIIGKKEGDLPYFKTQLEDMNFKYPDGESGNETQSRFYNALERIINNNNGKKIGIVTHLAALLFLLNKWCEIKVIDNTTKNVEIKFNDELVFSGSLKTPDVFELTFDENKNLKSIKHI